MECWDAATEWERDWWGNCANTLGEEIKQTVYAEKMGLQFTHDGKSPYNLRLSGSPVIVDIGGGPCSLLLKTIGARHAIVVDPCRYPEWVAARYYAAGIEYLRMPGEELDFEQQVDEIWIYNVLQHVQNPAEIARRARAASRLVRVFEWLGVPASVGHPHVLTKESLNEWFHGRGKVERINDRGCVGEAWYGIFLGDLC